MPFNNNMNNDQKQFEADLREMLNSPAGRRVLRIFLCECNLLRGSFVMDSARATDYNEGIRSIGLWLATWIEGAAPGELYKVLSEPSGGKR